MAQKQPSVRSTEYLKTLNVQQLRQILRAEFESDKNDVELIRNITAVLAEKDENAQDISVEDKYREFLAEQADTEPLYDEVAEEMDEKPSVHAREKRVRFSRLPRAAVAAAVIIVVLFAGSFAAEALGFKVWTAVKTWTQEHFGYAKQNGDDRTGRTKSSDEYKGLADLLKQNGIFVSILPRYLPEGYKRFDTTSQETFDGIIISGVFKNSEQEDLIISYNISDNAANMYFPKDNENPDIYTVAGIEHSITTNKGEYRATWINGNILCKIHGVKTREELLKMIDSIYREE